MLEGDAGQPGLFVGDEAPEAAVPRALIVRRPWADMIASGVKRWEIRGTSTSLRGPMAIAAAGSGTIVGVCSLAGVLGPLTAEEYQEAWRLWGGAEGTQGPLPYLRTYAWVLTQARPLDPPIPYRHPAGAVIWVKLNREVQACIRRALGPDRTASEGRG